MKKLLPALVALLLALPASASSDLFISSTGNVGIGTTSPVYNLDVLGSTTSSSARLTSSSTDSTNLFLRNTTTGGQIWYAGTVGSSNPDGEDPGSFHIGLNGTGTFLGITTSGEVNVPNNESILGNLDVSGVATLGDGSTAVTQSPNDNSTKIATTAYVDNATGGGGSGVKSISVQTFTSSGTYTPTTGMAYAIVEIVGAGGGSSGCNGGSGAPGGGAGGYAKVLETAAQIGASETVTIGAAGSAGNSTPTAGGNGGTTSLGSLVSCTGGDGSSTVSGGGAGSVFFGPGATGGSCTVSTGDTIIASAGQQGGMGGGANYASADQQTGGYGGSNPLGWGGTQVFSASGGSHATSSASSGVGYGSGAGGCASSSGTLAGAAGNAGFITITEYSTQ